MNTIESKQQSSSLTTAPASVHVQASYSRRFGMTLRVNGQSRPSSLDEIEQNYGQTALYAVMEAPGTYVTIAGEPTRHRVTVIARDHAGNMGFLTVETDSGEEMTLTDLACCFANVSPGDRGSIELRFGAKAEPFLQWVRDAADEFESMPAPMPITIRPVVIDMAKYERAVG